jgi:carboxyl-terminal processing protease
MKLGVRVLRIGRFWLAAGCLALLAVGLLIGFVVAVIGFRQVGNLLEVIAIIRADYIEEVSPGDLVDGAAKGIVGSLGDPYSIYLEPRTYRHLKDQIRGSFGGLGIVVGLKEGRLTVVKPFPDTPAGRAGIKSGDVITGINDEDTEGLDLETAVNLMRGPIGTDVTLTLMRAGSGPLNLTLRREEIKVPSVEGKLLPEKIGYIAISQFSEKTPAELDRVISDLRTQEMRALILDLRDNPGGELHAAVKVADYFVPRGPVVYVNFKRGRDEVHSADSDRLALPVVVLVNEYSASASEIVAAAIKETGSGSIVGTRTYGKGLVQSVYPLKNGAGLKLTTARYLTPKKNDINERGVEPDVVVEQPEDGEEDRQLTVAQQNLLRSLRNEKPVDLRKAAGT